MKWHPLLVALACRLGGAVLLGFFLAGGLQAQVVYTWTAGDILTGTITPSGATTFNVGDTLNIGSGNDHDFNGLAVTNNGTVNWSAGAVRSGNGGTFTNHGTWNDTVVGYSFNSAFGGAPAAFINAADGVYNKTSGTTAFTTVFNNAGTIAVSGGTLSFQAGGTFTDGSVIGSSGPGVLQLVAGTLTMTGNITATNFLFNGGTLAGDQTFTGSVLNWQTGDWNSANTTTLASNSTLNIFSGNNHDFNSHTIISNGTVNWSGGAVRSGNGGSITNNGTWNDSSNGYPINDAYGGTGGTTFTIGPTGLYLKTAGTTSFSDGVLVNNGTISVTGGEIDIVGAIFGNNSTVGSSGGGLVQLTSGLLTASGTINVQNFVLNGGELTGTQTFLGTLTWVTGDLNTSGSMTIASGTTLTISSGNDHNFSSHAIVNNGTVNWTGGAVRSGNGGTITNNATWNDTSNGYPINDAYGGTGGTTFLNAVGATYLKSSGVTSLSDSVLVNDGTISVTGGELDLVGAVFNDGSTIGSSGTGLVQLTSGLLTANGTINVQNFVLNGGQLTGTQTFAGTLSWLAGDLNTSGSMTVASGATLAIASGNDHNFSSHAIVNNGTVNWSGGALRSGNGGTITNNATWNDTSSGYPINDAYGGTGGTTFLNAAGGTYLKTAGVTTLSDGVLVNNGTVSVTGGELDLVGATLNNGSFTGSSGSGLLQFTGGLLAASGVVNVQNLLITGGQLTGTQTFAGTLSWLNGDLNTSGSMTLATGGTFAIASGNDHNFNGHAITNDGTVDWSGGALRSGNGGTITNNGAWNDTANGYTINNAYGGTGGTTFINGPSGVYTKNGGTSAISADLNNQGTINVVSGTLATSGNVTNTGTIAIASGASLVLGSATSFSGGSLLTGGGSLVVPTLTESGAISPGTSTVPGALAITGDLSLLGTSQMLFKLGGTVQGSQYDFLSVAGNLGLGGNLGLKFAGGFETSVNNSMTFTVVSSGSLLSSFSNVANGARLTSSDGLGSFVVNYGAGSPFGANNVVLSSFISVPEPSTWALLLAGTAAVGWSRRRQRRRAAAK